MDRGNFTMAISSSLSLKTLAAVLPILAILGFKDDAWLQHLHCMPCTGRHHTAKVAKARVKHIASRLLEPFARRYVLRIHAHREVLGNVLLLVYYFHEFARESNYRLIAMRMAMDGNDKRYKQNAHIPFAIVFDLTVVFTLSESLRNCR